MSAKEYLFRSARLGFRDWLPADIVSMAAINADAKGMEFFPRTQTHEQTIEFIEKMQKQLAEKSYCYFAVDKLETGEFIGFIGLSEQTYEAEFTPCIDIGWRIKVSEWNRGYATEGAMQCLVYAQKNLHIQKIMSVAPVINVKSISVMKKIGMHYVKTFAHPLLNGNERLQQCVLYEIVL